MNQDILMLGVIVFLLLANAFFVGAEFALISARRTSIEPRARSGNTAARMTLYAMENISLMLAGAQLGITICSLLLGYVGKPAVKHLLSGPAEALGMPEVYLDPLAFGLSLLIVVALHVIIGEMVPKNIALTLPDRSALFLGPPMVVVVIVLYPALWVVNQIANVTLRLFGVVPKDEITSAYTRDEVAGLVQQSGEHGLLDSQEERLLVSALTFEERDARSVLIPAREVESVPLGVSTHQLETVVARTHYSRFPVLGADGRPVGYIHLKDFLETPQDQRHAPSTLRHVRTMPSVQDTDSLRTILETMQLSGAHLASVWEKNTFAGMVALEDVLEELVGEVRDESRRSMHAQA